MKTLYFALGLLLVSAEALAGTCNNATVSGAYSFQLSSVGNSGGLVASTYDAGRFSFNGAGSVSVSGVESEEGFAASFSAHGTYTVTSGCVLNLSFFQPSSSGIVAKTFSLWVFLDSLDTAPSTNVAYHGSIVYKTSIGMSGVGKLDRVTGKF